MVKELLNEYNLEIDDIRWYLSFLYHQKLLSYQHTPEELIKYIWSGELEASLYNMEEQYLNDLEEQLERNVIDESTIRDNFSQAALLKNNR